MSRKLTGGNIRTGQTPGGMMTSTYDASPRKRRSNGKGIVHAAASAFLAGRGFNNEITGFEAAAINYPRPSL